jgi:nicotinamide phosphoribosyltransferase
MNNNYDPLANLIADSDSYKFGHWLMLPDGTTQTHAHMLSRGGRYGRTTQWGMRPITIRMAQWAELTTKERMLHVQECADFAPDHGLPFNDQEESFIRFIEKFKDPKFKYLSAISDTIDIYDCVENIWCGTMLDLVKASGKTIVIRPDSGKAPVIMPDLLHIMDRKIGCTTNGKGFKVLPPYYRFIWGDGNKTEDDIRDMLMSIKQHGFSASNMVSGMGGGLLQLVDRDMQMFKFMVSAMNINGSWREVKKTPKTDVHKVSRAGRLDLIKRGGQYETVNLTPDQAFHSLTELHTIFEDGKIGKTWTLDESRAESRRALLET